MLLLFAHFSAGQTCHLARPGNMVGRRFLTDRNPWSAPKAVVSLELTECILFIGIRTLSHSVTRGYDDHSPLTTTGPKEEGTSPEVTKEQRGELADEAGFKVGAARGGLDAEASFWRRCEFAVSCQCAMRQRRSSDQMMFVELCEQQTFLFDRVLSTRWSHFLYHCPYESHSIPPPRISMLRKCWISYLSGILTMHEARRRGRPAAGAAHARVGVIKSVLMAHSIAGTLAFHAAPQHKLMVLVLRTSRTGGRSPAHELRPLQAPGHTVSRLLCGCVSTCQIGHPC